MAELASGGICLAFSGGVDSAVLLAVASGEMKPGKIHAVTVQTPLHSPVEPENARKLAEEWGAIHSILVQNELNPVVAQNPPDRCYLCKRWLFGTIEAYAKEHGLAAVVDGTHADDLKEYRPGLKALAELKIKSPLAELGITKAEVREIAASLGISVAKKPSAPCLATRFPYGTPLTATGLQTIDRLEQQVRAMGFDILRIRVYHDMLRIEVPVESLPYALQYRNDIIKAAHQEGFSYVTLDLEGFRSGSMDIPLKNVKKVIDNPKII